MNLYERYFLCEKIFRTVLTVLLTTLDLAAVLIGMDVKQNVNRSYCYYFRAPFSHHSPSKQKSISFKADFCPKAMCKSVNIYV